MRCTKYFVLFCNVLAYSHVLSITQATPLQQKRALGNLTSQDNVLANATASGLGNSTGTAGRFEIKLDAGGETLTMNVGPLPAFTETTVSRHLYS